MKSLFEKTWATSALNDS